MQIITSFLSKNKIEALIWAIVCQGAFTAAVLIMAWQLYFGLGNGIVSIDKPFLWVWNLFLLCQFPLLHSFLLAKAGRSWIERILGPDRKILIPSLYVTIASLQLMLTFIFWAPSHVTVARISGNFLYVSQVTYLVGWILLLRSMWEAGLSIQMGYGGWRSLWKGEALKYPKFAREGLHGKCRHPIYLAFFLILLSGPVWTLDHLLIASIWGTYCLIGPKLKEMRYNRFYGQEFSQYKKQVPYFPKLKFSWKRS